MGGLYRHYTRTSGSVRSPWDTGYPTNRVFPMSWTLCGPFKDTPGTRCAELKIMVSVVRFRPRAPPLFLIENTIA